jgi:hypothetical protein
MISSKLFLGYHELPWLLVGGWLRFITRKTACQIGVGLLGQNRHCVGGEKCLGVGLKLLSLLLWPLRDARVTREMSLASKREIIFAASALCQTRIVNILIIWQTYTAWYARKNCYLSADCITGPCEDGVMMWQFRIRCVQNQTIKHCMTDWLVCNSVRVAGWPHSFAC